MLENINLYWWFVGQTIIIVACFISVDRYNFKRAMVMQTHYQDILAKLDRVELMVENTKDAVDDIEVVRVVR